MNSLSGKRISAVVFGASQGGFNALSRALGPLPSDFSVPILVVRHQSAQSDDYLLKNLNRVTQLQVKYAEENEEPKPGSVYVAPPDRHLIVGMDGTLQLSSGPKQKFSRPSIDVLIASAASYYGEKLLAIVLTGANDDGADGVIEVRKQGGLIIVQDPESAEAPTMPLAAIATGCVDHTIWLDQIGPFIWNLTREG